MKEAATFFLIGIFAALITLTSMKEVLTFGLIWIFAALVTATLWHAAVGGNDDDNYPPKI